MINVMMRGGIPNFSIPTPLTTPMMSAATRSTPMATGMLRMLCVMKLAPSRAPIDMVAPMERLIPSPPAMITTACATATMVRMLPIERMLPTFTKEMNPGLTISPTAPRTTISVPSVK